MHNLHTSLGLSRFRLDVESKIKIAPPPHPSSSILHTHTQNAHPPTHPPEVRIIF